MEVLEATVQHQWKPMEEYHLDDANDIVMEIEGVISEREVLEKMKPNQYRKFDGSLKQLQKRIENLKEEGLDIGKGNCMYGYKFPLPERKVKLECREVEPRRELIIFRRYE
jgi:hypothetical protein